MYTFCLSNLHNLNIRFNQLENYSRGMAYAVPISVGQASSYY